jgi:hypothetical protein
MNGSQELRTEILEFHWILQQKDLIDWLPTVDEVLELKAFKITKEYDWL